MYEIMDYDKLYRPHDKSGGELKHATYVKLPVKPKGDGLQELLEYKRGLEIFGIWCLLLEKATDAKPENRGKLLNHREEPADIEEIAKGISLKNKVSLVERALNVLVTIGWLHREQTSAETEHGSGKVPPKSSVVKSTKEKRREEKFKAPTLSEIIEYVKKNNYAVDAKKFFDYYAASDWHDREGKPVRNWKQKVISWSGRGGSSGKKIKLPPIIGKTCSKPDCRLPAVYKDTSGDWDRYDCAKHMPDEVKKQYV